MTRSPTYLEWHLRQPCALWAPSRCQESDGAVPLFFNDPEDDLSTVRLCRLHLTLTTPRAKPLKVDGAERWHVVPCTLRLEALKAWMRFCKTATPGERRCAWNEIESCL